MNYDPVKWFACTAYAEQLALREMFRFDAGFFRWDTPTVVLSAIFLSQSPEWWEERFEAFITIYGIERIYFDLEGFPVDVLRIQGSQWWETYQAFLAGTIYPGMPRCATVRGFGHPL